MITFEKKYSRESTLMVQEVWMKTSLIDMPAMFKDETIPKPAILIDCADGMIEIWTSQNYSDWVIGRSAKHYGQELSVTQSIIDTYNTKLSDLKSIYLQDIKDVSGFNLILDKMEEAMSYLMILFYVITSEDSKQECRDLALKVRETDTFFVDAEIYLEKSLKKLFPVVGSLFSFIILDDLQNGVKVEELKLRKEKFLFLDGLALGNISINQYVTEHPEIKLYDQTEEVVKTREFKGQTAQKGVVTGKVRIVKKRDQAALVEEGEIIVSPMTTPDFLPAMLKAVAFVTDEGGITCHAAIVSRELKKPCIIGTKVATRVLKDGDFVEVDADNGIVKIIK